uniref:Uncharacterized protein n=1 Tax=Moorena producens (strain JHB) TaxID=1454205 RepID=A0A1D9G280_MOOP1
MLSNSRYANALSPFSNQSNQPIKSTTIAVPALGELNLDQPPKERVRTLDEEMEFGCQWYTFLINSLLNCFVSRWLKIEPISSSNF